MKDVKSMKHKNSPIYFHLVLKAGKVGSRGNACALECNYKTLNLTQRKVSMAVTMSVLQMMNSWYLYIFETVNIIIYHKKHYDEHSVCKVSLLPVTACCNLSWAVS